MKNRDASYYLNLHYDYIITKVQNEGGDSYKAFTNELDSLTFYGVGDTPEEAIKSLDQTKRDLFPYYLEHGFEIPEPERHTEEMPSGKFVVRTSPKLHYRLINLAKQNNQSLNQYVNFIFSNYSSFELIKTKVFSDLENAIGKLESIGERCPFKAEIRYTIPKEKDIYDGYLKKNNIVKAA